MIQKINLLHYLTEETYKKVCVKLGFNDTANNVTVSCDEKVTKINLYNIKYKQFGHIWFMDIEANFPKFDCGYDAFEENLYAHYRTIFGEDIMSEFPPYDELCCSYIEYSETVELKDDPVGVIKGLKSKCEPEQLDKQLWDKYKKPHGTIEFCMSINENNIETLARCHGTALKKRITDTTMHRTVGLIPSAAINKGSEGKILGWLLERYHISK